MKNRPIYLISLGITLVLLQLAVISGLAQSNSQINLSLHKVVGYKSGFWSSQLEAQGTLKVNADVPSAVTRVTFYINGDTIMGEDSQAPFDLQFSSDTYPPGMHTITARGFTNDGGEIGSNALSVKFVTAAESVTAGLLIAVPLAVLVIIVSSASWLITRTKRQKLVRLPPGTPRTYGSAGGAICGRCGRPFALHSLSLNLVNLKLERCPYCGYLRFVRRRTLNELHVAEAAELKMADSEIKLPALDVEEKLRRELDASRYQKD